MGARSDLAAPKVAGSDPPRQLIFGDCESVFSWVSRLVLKKISSAREKPLPPFTDSACRSSMVKNGPLASSECQKLRMIRTRAKMPRRSRSWFPVYFRGLT